MWRVDGAIRAAIRTASSRPRTRSVRSSGCERVVGLQAQAVLDGDEVEQPALGLGDQVGPVAGREQVGRAGVGLAPGGGVPAGAVQGDGQVNMALLKSMSASTERTFMNGVSAQMLRMPERSRRPNDVDVRILLRSRPKRWVKGARGVGMAGTETVGCRVCYSAGRQHSAPATRCRSMCRRQTSPGVVGAQGRRPAGGCTSASVSPSSNGSGDLALAETVWLRRVVTWSTPPRRRVAGQQARACC